jgi:hypothetical protein
VWTDVEGVEGLPLHGYRFEGLLLHGSARAKELAASGGWVVWSVTVMAALIVK